MAIFLLSALNCVASYRLTKSILHWSTELHWSVIHNWRAHHNWTMQTIEQRFEKWNPSELRCITIALIGFSNGFPICVEREKNQENLMTMTWRGNSMSARTISIFQEECNVEYKWMRTRTNYDRLQLSARLLNVPVIIFNGFCFSWYRHHYLINDHLRTSLQLKLYRLLFWFNFSSLSRPPFFSLSLRSCGPSIMCRLVLVLNIKQIDANQAQRVSLWIWILKARMK